MQISNQIVLALPLLFSHLASAQNSSMTAMPLSSVSTFSLQTSATLTVAPVLSSTITGTIFPILNTTTLSTTLTNGSAIITSADSTSTSNLATIVGVNATGSTTTATNVVVVTGSGTGPTGTASGNSSSATPTKSTANRFHEEKSLVGLVISMMATAVMATIIV